jgi:outer membrane lipoprotein-sorting protein
MRTPRTPSFSSLLAAAALVAAAAGFARAAEAPEPSALLDAVLTAPTVAYSGRLTVTQWYGKQTRAEEMRVMFLPPDNIRREFLSPDGTVTRVSVSDGEVESVRLIRAGKTVVGDAVRSYEKVMSPELERQALMSNYELSSSTAEKIAGRPTWKLMMKPNIEGKPWQTLWLDQETKIVLRSRRFLPKRPFASKAEFAVFEPRAKLDPALFVVDGASTGTIQGPGLAPDFLTLAQLNAATGDAATLPEKLPGGFIFESADVFPVGKSKVRHARYTDGLTVISLFLTDRRVRLPKGGVISSGSTNLPGLLHASRAGKLIQWGGGVRHFTLMGDVSRELVADIVKSLR